MSARAEKKWASSKGELSECTDEQLIATWKERGVCGKLAPTSTNSISPVCSRGRQATHPHTLHVVHERMGRSFSLAWDGETGEMRFPNE